MLKNITLSAHPEKLEQLRQLAHSENKTVNQLFREWLDGSVAKKQAAQRAKQSQVFKASIEKFSFTSDRKYGRQEMNER